MRGAACRSRRWRCSSDRQTLDAGGSRPTFDASIDPLRELRARLIADVVTGKLDVREAAANLPALARSTVVGLGASTMSPSWTRRVGRPRRGAGMTSDTSEQGLESLIVAQMTTPKVVGWRAIRRTTSASTASTSCSSAPSCRRLSPRSRTLWISRRTVPVAGASSPGSRARSPSAALSMSCAAESSTVH